MPPPLPTTTFLSLPVEIRLKIYNHVFTTSTIHFIRPQRRLGWNRPHADLSNPAALFQSDSHPILNILFHSKLTKLDHALILAILLRHVKVLIVDHADFAALQKLVSTPPGGALAGPNDSSSRGRASTSGLLMQQGRSNAMIVKENLQTIDFSDKLDEIICQPSDLTKLLNCLPGLRTVYLASKHVQRYSGTIDEHVEFARDRALSQTENNGQSQQLPSSLSMFSPPPSSAIGQSTAHELQRLTLKSPMTDGSRMMMISPASNNNPRTCKWVVVDLSMIVWQHFLYTGAPYKDHWRCAKMQTLLDVAEEKGVHVVLKVRDVEFDPSSDGVVRRTASRTGSPFVLLNSSVFRGEMSTKDWVLRLRHRGTGVEYGVRQRRWYDVPVSQDGCGLRRCKHKRRVESLCESCEGAVEVANDT